jgi:membrane protein DedA with SNARE-associated domain
MMSIDDFWQYFGVFAALVVSAFGAPIPEEIPIATGGVLVGRIWENPQDGPRWFIMLPLCILGVVLCDSILYFVGRKWGYQLLQKKWVQERILPPTRRQKIEKNFHDYGIGILLIARLLPGIRTPVFMTAGIIRLPFRKFILADVIYAIPGVNIIFWLAYWFTDRFMKILEKMETYREVVVVALVAYMAGFATAWYFQRRASTGDPQDIPVVGKTVVQIHHHLSTQHSEAEKAKAQNTTPPDSQPIPPKAVPSEKGEIKPASTPPVGESK